MDGNWYITTLKITGIVLPQLQSFVNKTLPPANAKSGRDKTVKSCQICMRSAHKQIRKKDAASVY